MRIEVLCHNSYTRFMPTTMTTCVNTHLTNSMNSQKPKSHAHLTGRSCSLDMTLNFHHEILHGQIPQEQESESAAAFKAVVKVTIYAILILLFLFLMWRTQCCCYPLRVCCHAICSRICCCCCCRGCCDCCNPKVMAKKIAVSAVNKYAPGMGITADGQVS